jgi:hypothetical protein
MGMVLLIGFRDVSPSKENTVCAANNRPHSSVERVGEVPGQAPVSRAWFPAER